MNKQFLEEQKGKLKKAKEKLEKELSSFARKNDKVDGDWITNYPRFEGGDLEEGADEVEEYGNKLSVSYVFEINLKRVNKALEKIKKGEYGICETCGGKISKGRLEVYPQAESCMKCINKNK